MSAQFEKLALEWLKNVDLYPKFFWKNRENSVILAGCGQADRDEKQFPSLIWRSFCSKQSEEWKPFSCNKILPSLSRKWVGRSLPNSTFSKPLPSSYPSLSESCIPTKSQWNQTIINAINEIDTGSIEKVVCAKKVQIQCTSPIDPLSFFSRLNRSHLSAFYIQMNSSSTFLGISPERLFRRKGRNIECDALAATRPTELAHELFQSEKDLKEFGFVQKEIIERLRPFCSKPPKASPTKLAHTAHLSHLHSIISGKLKEEIDDQMLLQALHPTPAVGGYPREAAMRFLNKHEPFARGLYAAPIGYSTPDEADFTVAIRSCLIEKNLATLFAGTGIVQLSDPSLEWEESEQKLFSFKEMLYGQ